MSDLTTTATQTRLMFALSGSDQEVQHALIDLKVAIDRFEQSIAVVRQPVGMSGSSEYTPARQRALDYVHIACDEMVRVNRAVNDLRKADVPIRPIPAPVAPITPEKGEKSESPKK